MKMNLRFRLIISTALFFATFSPGFSQVLQVSSDITPEEMVQILIGSGLQYSNVLYTGADLARGQFWGGPGNIGISEGIILTSGRVQIAPGPNNSGSAGADNGAPGDADLELLANSGFSFDACVLEFDFVPEFEYVWFHFVFASEEYHEYVGQFNDAFGFFISGPGISGPYSNNSTNIALIPLTGIPVTINTVNCGNPYNCQESCMNCQYFVNNDGQFIQYDAFTTVLTASAYVQPHQSYHIKLAISDMIDHAFDSGVLLEASSFCSGPVTGIKGKAIQNSGVKYIVYPVPARDDLNITGDNGKSFNIRLSSQDGRTIYSYTGKSEISIDLSSFPQGLYILRITDESGVMIKKIFKD